MNTEETHKQQLLSEIETQRQQIAHLREGNQKAILRLEERVAELRALNAIGQLTAEEVSLDELYRKIHAVIKAIIGEVNFMIALYNPAQDQISIPYAVEAGELLKIDPFPLGEGLTSILIRTRKPLMIVKDTVNKAHEMGAKITGDLAKSWLGAPLIVAGEIIGAIIIQDLENENRFDYDDQRLLSTLGTQVAVAIRNIALIEGVRAQADRERLLFEITSKIRRSVDIQAILETTVTEIGKSLDIRKATIAIQPQEIIPPPEADINGKDIWDDNIQIKKSPSNDLDRTP